MPQMPKGFVPDGFEPDAPSAPRVDAASSLAAHIGPQSGEVVTEGDPPKEGLLSRTIRGMLHPTPTQQLVMDVLPLGAAAAEAAPDAALRAAGTVKAGAARTGAAVAPAAQALVKPAATATGAAVGGPGGAIVGSAVGETLKDRLAAFLRARSAHQPTAEGYERYMPNTGAPAAAGAVQPVIPAQSDLALANKQLSGNMTWNPGGQTPTELSYEALENAPKIPPPVKPAMMPSPQMAKNQVALAARKLGFQLQVADEPAAIKAVQQGANPIEVAAALKPNAAAAFAAKYGTPTDAAVAADMQQRAMAGQKSLMPAYGPKP